VALLIPLIFILLFAPSPATSAYLNAVPQSFSGASLIYFIIKAMYRFHTCKQIFE
jgi:hypothetical protein